ncbi:MAG: serine/threonine-protein kinase, partial [Kofleriaceae bacterium]
MRSQADIAGGCLGPDTLAGFVEERVDAAARARVEEHASRCHLCREVLSSLARDGTPPPRAPHDGDDDRLPAGTLLGRYVIGPSIGAGGMGVVYAAHDPELARAVAVKLLRGAGDPAQRERLRREAQAMARLAHPHVVAVYDAGVIGERMFIAMELVEGETLAQWLRQGRTPDEILEAYRAAGRGLAAAHEVGIVHRDVKPENILVGKDGRVRIGDFGLARDDAEPVAVGSPEPPRGSASRTGGLLGTPSYMAPELYRGSAADERSDQFSFCVALFTALYGERPFPGETLGALIGHLQAGDRRTPRHARRVPRRVRAAIERGLAHDAAARFGSMRALLAQLAPSDRRRARWLAATAALVVATVGAAAVIAPRVVAMP